MRITEGSVCPSPGKPGEGGRQAGCKAGIGLTTYYRWKALHENPVSNEQLRIFELEDEIGRLKHLVAELALDRRMLQEALKKKP